MKADEEKRVGAEFPLAYGGKIMYFMYVDSTTLRYFIVGVGSFGLLGLVAFSLSAVGSTAKYPYSLSTERVEWRGGVEIPVCFLTEE